MHQNRLLSDDQPFIDKNPLLISRKRVLMELMRNPSPDKRADSLAMTNYASIHVPVMKSVAIRAAQIERLAITSCDALQIAAGCEFLVTTDDRLLKKPSDIKTRQDGDSALVKRLASSLVEVHVS